MKETQTIKAECFGGPHDGLFWRTDGCTVDKQYILDQRTNEGYIPPNAPLYTLRWHKKTGQLLWEFDDYFRPSLR